MANSAVPDQTAPEEQSDLGIHCWLWHTQSNIYEDNKDMSLVTVQYGISKQQSHKAAWADAPCDQGIHIQIIKFHVAGQQFKSFDQTVQVCRLSRVTSTSLSYMPTQLCPCWCSIFI